MTKIIDSFSGEYAFLSNFAKRTILYKGEWYATNEHAFQAAKTFVRGERDGIREASTPRIAKQRGRMCTLQPKWDDVKDQVMYDCCIQKFKGLVWSQKLLATEDATLIEGNTWGDSYWGVCNGQGQNQLGRILMKVRDHLESAT